MLHPISAARPRLSRETRDQIDSLVERIFGSSQEPAEENAEPELEELEGASEVSSVAVAEGEGAGRGC